MNNWLYKYRITLFTGSFFYVVFVIASSWKVAKLRIAREHSDASLYSHRRVSSRLIDDLPWFYLDFIMI